MPTPAQPEITQDQVARFHALTPDQRQIALSRMTPELKQRFLPAALEYKAMHAPDSAYPQTPRPLPQLTGARKAFDRTAQFMVNEAPTIAGAVGGILGSAGGLGGAVAGAAAGGAYGSAIRSKAEGGKISGKEVAKGAGEQGALELGGGLVGKGLLKTANLLGVDESLMKFALKRGEDYERELNPAAAMNKYRLQALTTKELYQKTAQKISTLNKTADAMLDQVSGYSSTIRPYAVVKGVIDRYKSQAAKVGDPAIKDAMDEMLDAVGREFNNVQTGAQGMARAAGTPAKAAESLPTDRLMTTQEANRLKQMWGESVSWNKEPPKDSMQAAFKAAQNARRDIYHSLNNSIADAMGGNQGRLWRSTNHDIFNLMEAKGALQEAGERTASDARGVLPQVLDSMRKPGVASKVAAMSRGIPSGLAVPGVISNTARGGSMGADVLFSPNSPQNPIPLPSH